MGFQAAVNKIIKTFIALVSITEIIERWLLSEIADNVECHLNDT